MSLKALVFDGAANREVIEALVGVVSQAENFMHRVVEEAADTCASDAMRASASR